MSRSCRRGKGGRAKAGRFSGPMAPFYGSSARYLGARAKGPISAAGRPDYACPQGRRPSIFRSSAGPPILANLSGFSPALRHPQRPAPAAKRPDKWGRAEC